MHPESILPVDAPKVHVALLKTWLALRQSATPQRSDFDLDDLFPREHEAFEVGAGLGNCGPSDFFFGRVSAEAKAKFGLTLPGSPVKHAFEPREYEAIARKYRSAMETGTPHYWERYTSFYGRDPQHYKRLLLPLVDDVTGATWLLSSMVWPSHEGF